MASTATKRIVIGSGREKSLRRRHPWIFSGAIERVEGGPEPGDTVDVLDRRGAFLARAAWSPASQIRARAWTFDPEERVDDAFFGRRVSRAVETRARLGLLDADEACRVVYAESDGLPGVIADRYGRHVVCQFLSAGAERWRDVIVAALGDALTPAGIYERSEGAARRKEGLASRRQVLAGAEPPPRLEFRSGGLQRIVDVAHGQKTGAYLDQQLNRQRVARHAAGASVLDAFAYTGGFATAAVVAGAKSAVLLDSSGDALRAAREEAALNGVADRCRFVEADVFDELRALREQGRRFDLIVMDPPKFVHSAQQVAAGSRGYKDVNLLALQLLAPGGILATFSCSGHVDAALFQKILAGAAVDAGRPVQILERFTQPPDHPVALEFPEADYLNGLLLTAH
ncbi:MAG: class I SAM-dependent methyltransferase [Gammaproteobacteria bacterium]|nr:class I SAM-dependent methyltransferase [Gammaproteobacteria bacterium]